MDNSQKLFVVTVWDKDIKRWYNYHYEKEETDKIKKPWWINSRFEDYKKEVKRIIVNLKNNKDECEYVRFFLTTNSEASSYYQDYGIKDKDSVIENFKDRLHTKENMEPKHHDKTYVQSYLSKHLKLKSKLGEQWLQKLKDKQEFYFYCSSKNFDKEVKNDVLINEWAVTMGEDFINNYNSKPENLILVTLDDPKLNEYLEGYSSDFTIFGFGSKEIRFTSPDWVDQVIWLFALGVELDPQKEALLFNFSFKNIPLIENNQVSKNLIEENYKRKLKILSNASERLNGKEILELIKGN